MAWHQADSPNFVSLFKIFLILGAWKSLRPNKYKQIVEELELCETWLFLGSLAVENPRQAVSEKFFYKDLDMIFFTLEDKTIVYPYDEIKARLLYML